VGHSPNRVTQRLHGELVEARKQKAHSEEWAKCLNLMGWLMGLEPTTTGITIRSSNVVFPYEINSLKFFLFNKNSETITQSCGSQAIRWKVFTLRTMVQHSYSVAFARRSILLS
jgi:hypothetical protein